MNSKIPTLLAALESMAIWRDGEPCFCHVHGEGEPMNRWLVPPHKHDEYCQYARKAIQHTRDTIRAQTGKDPQP